MLTQYFATIIACYDHGMSQCEPGGWLGTLIMEKDNGCDINGDYSLVKKNPKVVLFAIGT